MRKTPTTPNPFCMKGKAMNGRVIAGAAAAAVEEKKVSAIKIRFYCN